ncbi:MAG: terminase family protein [Planctomycetota bacterium]
MTSTAPDTIDAPTPVTDRKSSGGRVLLPYQEAWRRDGSRMKIWEKSRRIGATYVEANDAVMSRLTRQRRSHYWFSSADESAAFEFADYCRFWLKVAGTVVEIVTEDVRDDLTGRDAKAFVVAVQGQRVTAMSSNPRRFRSKGGDVCLDEYGFHDDPRRMWAAAYPTITWGDSIRVMSTHNGEGSEFHKKVLAGEPFAEGVDRRDTFSVHRVTIHDAVAQGLVAKINDIKGTSMSDAEFLAACRAGCQTEDDWLQEFMAIPSKDATAWLPYELIEACESDAAGDPARYADGQRYIGMDIGEQHDRTVIWTLERVGDVLWTREVVVFTDEPMSVKEKALLDRLAHPKVVRAVVDATGLGTQIGQAAERTNKAEAVKFTLPVKDELASPLRGLFEDRRVRVPGDSDTREQLHAIRMSRTAGGTPRYDAARTEDGHADKFWALAMACHAARVNDAVPPPLICGDPRLRKEAA